MNCCLISADYGMKVLAFMSFRKIKGLSAMWRIYSMEVREFAVHGG
jgi:hypothetical protein